MIDSLLSCAIDTLMSNFFSVSSALPAMSVNLLYDVPLLNPCTASHASKVLGVSGGLAPNTGLSRTGLGEFSMTTSFHLYSHLSLTVPLTQSTSFLKLSLLYLGLSPQCPSQMPYLKATSLQPEWAFENIWKNTHRCSPKDSVCSTLQTIRKIMICGRQTIIVKNMKSISRQKHVVHP